MKNIILGMAMSSLLLAACNNNKQTNDDTKDTVANTNSETAEAKKVSAVDAVTKDYLKLKNALVEDNDQLAAEAGKSLVTSLGAVDKTQLSSEQAKVFEDINADAKEHAEHIGSNVGNIKHQREHFEMLSGEIYDLLKADKAMGQKLYYDNCPMFNKGKGGNWISETKDIKNPYYGKSMSDCGSVKEELN
ncbi:MAG: DUF3347 domain-containing protein [Sphingobacteriales bacterium]|nr:MAG: DUF3347 domain-containing protein [Sphingobacteriales bacterium]